MLGLSGKFVFFFYVSNMSICLFLILHVEALSGFTLCGSVYSYFFNCICLLFSFFGWLFDFFHFSSLECEGIFFFL